MNIEYINEQIKQYYKDEDTVKLALRLDLTVTNLRKKASRLGIKKGPKTNRVVEGESKLCSKCGRVLPLTEFRKDKYQTNGLDYNCKQCRADSKLNRTVTKTVSLSVNSLCDNSDNDTKFNQSKKRNPVVKMGDTEYLKCKSCKKLKPLNEFHKDKNNLHGHKNFCKQCVSNKKKRS